jgi:hypothetical protein
MEMQVTVTRWEHTMDDEMVAKQETFAVEMTQYEELRERFHQQHDLDNDEAAPDFEQWLFEELVA